MKVPYLHCILGIAAAFLPNGAEADSPVQKPGNRPNIIFILADDMGWKDAGYMGSTYLRTPHLDRMAAEGIRFEYGYSPAPVCIPSRGSIYSGKNPARNKLTHVFAANPGAPDDKMFVGGDGWERSFEKSLKQNAPASQLHCLRRSERTFGEVLTQNGYATAFFGKWHCGEIPGYYPDERGWQIAKGYRLAKSGGTTRGHWGRDYPNGELANLPNLKPDDYLSDVLTDEAVQFIKTNKDRPFHIVLAHYLVHGPIQAKPGMPERYQNAIPTDQQDPKYAAMVESLDDSIGRIFGALREAGVDQNTLVVFTSDNGGVQSNYPLMGHKGNCFEAGERVPFLMRWPAKIKPGSICRERVIATDLYPTFLEAAGLPLLPEQHQDGLSLMPLMNGADHLPPRPIVFHTPHYSTGAGSNPNSTLVENQWKLMRFYNDSEGRHLLFDLASDPYEQKDLSQSQPERVRTMDARLSSLLAGMDAEMMTPNPLWDPKKQPQIGTKKAILEHLQKPRAVYEKRLREGIEKLKAAHLDTKGQERWLPENQTVTQP